MPKIHFQLSHRLMVTLLLISAVPIIFGLYLTIAAADPRILELIQARHPIFSGVIGFSGAVASLTYFGLWILMLLHWKHHEFVTKRQRVNWLLVLLLLSFMGAIIYYFRIAAKGKPAEL